MVIRFRFIINKILVINYRILIANNYLVINKSTKVEISKAIGRILATNYTKVTSSRDLLLEPTIAKIQKRLIINIYN